MPRDLLAAQGGQDLLAGKMPQKPEKSGLRQAGEFAASIPIGALNLGSKLGQGLAQLMLSPFGMEAPSGDISQFAPSPTGEMIGEIAGGFALPGGGLTRGSNLLGRLAGAGIEGAGYGGVLGAAEGDALGGAKRGAMLGTAFGAAAEGVGAGARKVGRAITGRATRTPEQVQALREAAPEFKADLFSMIGHPQGKEAYTQYLSAVPGSGARKFMEKTVKKADDYVNLFLEKMRGEVPAENVPETIQEAVQKKYLENEAIKRNNYANINKIAEDLGVNVHSRENLRGKAAEYAKKHRDALATDNKSALSKEAEALDDLELSMAPDVEPGKGSPRTLKQSMHTWSSFGEAGRRAENEGKKYVASMYKDLQNALEKDIDKSLADAGGEELKGMWTAAKEQFKNDVLPFRHRALKGIISENEPYAPDKIHQLLMGPKQRDVLKKLDPQTRGQIAHQHFVTNAGLDEDGNILLSPARMHNQFKKLPDDVKKALFADEDIEALNKLAAIRDITGEYATQIKKPATGMRNIGAGGMSAAGIGLMTNPMLTLKTMLSANLLNRALTSDMLLNSYISGDPSQLLQKLQNALEGTGRAALVGTSQKEGK